MKIEAEPLTLRYVSVERFNYAPESRRFVSRFIEPGIISYGDQNGGIELLRKETIDRCVESAVGNPLTVGHVLVNAENRLAVEHGIVDKWYYNPDDGWFYCEGTADTPDAQSRMRRGERPSCGYVVKSFGPGGVYHGIRYDREIADIEFNHLAIVGRPRYEGATFRLNSIHVSQPNTSMFKFLKKLVTRENGADGKEIEKIETKVSEISGETLVEIDGEKVRLNDMTSVWKTQAGQVFTASGDDEIEIDGQTVKMNDLVTAYRATRKNEAPKEEKKKEEPKQEQRDNAAPKEEVKKDEPKQEQRENAAPAPKQEDHFIRLHTARENAAATAPKPSTNSGSIAERVRRGQERYGSSPVVPGKN